MSTYSGVVLRVRQFQMHVPFFVCALDDDRTDLSAAPRSRTPTIPTTSTSSMVQTVSGTTGLVHYRDDRWLNEKAFSVTVGSRAELLTYHVDFRPVGRGNLSPSASTRHKSPLLGSAVAVTMWSAVDWAQVGSAGATATAAGALSPQFSRAGANGEHPAPRQ